MMFTKPSPLPTSRVNVCEDIASLHQFGGTTMRTEAGQQLWHERSDGKLVSVGLTGGSTDPLASYSYVLDRAGRCLTYTRREARGQVLIIRNEARDTAHGEGFMRCVGDVDQHFDELVNAVLAQIAARTA